MTTVKEVLEQATDVLMEQGWCQGAMRNDAGNVCSLGAFAEVLDLLPKVSCACSSDCTGSPQFVVINRAKRAFAKQIGTDEIAYWNDADERTAEDVILAFKQAAATAED